MFLNKAAYAGAISCELLSSDNDENLSFFAKIDRQTDGSTDRHGDLKLTYRVALGAKTGKNFD